VVGSPASRGKKKKSEKERKERNVDYFNTGFEVCRGGFWEIWDLFQSAMLAAEENAGKTKPAQS